MARGGGYLLCFFIFTFIYSQTVVAQVNQPPVWEEDLVDRLVTKGLDEDLFIRSVVGTLRARDPEGGRVIYNLTSEDNIFSVNSNTGAVSLMAPLDRERKARYDMTVYAVDDQGNTLARTYQARVRDVNDNSPQFQTPAGGFKATVNENAGVDTVVLNDIRLTDSDAGENSQLTVTCYVPESDEGARRACDTFRVETTRVSEGIYRVTITVNKQLDFERDRSYSLTLVAADGGSNQRKGFTTVTVNVGNLKDSVPRFLNVPVNINIFEGISKDTEVGELRIQDGDLGASQPLRIKIATGEDGLGWFRLGEPRVESVPSPQFVVPIYSNGNIDREAWDGVYEFDVEAIELVGGRETTSRARTTVRVTIRDRNDNGPTFNAKAYDIEVPEGLNRGNQLPGLDMIVKDADLGVNAEFGLSLEDDVWNTFSLSQQTCTGECAVSLVVDNSRAMDYEDGRYRRQIVRVVARETRTAEQRSATATVTVRLQDRNDNAPVFTQTRYTLSIREDRPVGFLVATIRASDADGGNLGTIRYRLVGRGGDTFDVNEMTGEIRLAKRLDFERQPSISLLYEARDLGDRVTRVPFDVTVLNFNDQGPVFTRDNLDVVVNDGTTRLIINVTAVDREQAGAAVTYRIASGNTRDNAFVINRFTGLITLLRPLRYEDTAGTGFIRLVVEASDSGNPPQRTTLPITITVRGVSNRRPAFNQPLYTGRVSEIAPTGQNVVTVLASDSDSGQNGQIRYQIASGSFGNFNIDPNSGVIRVSQNANLDIQRGGSTYRMVVQAMDGGSPSLTAQTQVVVTVTDANNKLPQFVQNVYLTSLLESSPVGTSILQLVANDPDANSMLTYSIRSNSVRAKDSNGQNISPSMQALYRDVVAVDGLSGIVRTRRMLSRDQVGEISFVAQVSDTNAASPSVQTATATVIVTIESDKQEQLQFSPPLTAANPDIRVTVPEEEDVGHIVYRLVALDPSTSRPVTNYEKVPGTDIMNYFFVNRLSGEVTLNRRLDYESLANRDLSFQVRATTTGPKILGAVARIIVTVSDVNDNSPVFSESSYTFSILEGQRFPMRMAVTATDADSGEFGKIRYTLTGKGRQQFYIDPVQGTFSVANNATLDREAIDGGVFNLVVKATDNPNGKPSNQRQTDVPLTIVVEDVNDNAPVFQQSQYNMYTRNNARAGTALGKVVAKDADVVTSGTITYSIAMGNTDDLFLIDRTTGVLRNQRDLTEYAKVAPYELQVVATDNGLPPLSTAVQVNVFVSDLQGNDDVPRIISPAKDGQTFGVPEDAGPGTNITRINAVARGTSPGTVSFRFLDNPSLRMMQSYFRIDPLTGVITLVKKLDREDRQRYQLIVVVENKLAATEIKRSMFVNVSDVDDNKPSFAACKIHMNPIVKRMLEENPENIDVVQVKACDLDAPPNDRIYYYIIEGNDPQPGSSTPPFTMDRTTGIIRTQDKLDRERKKSYTLYVKASDDPNLNITNYYVNASLGSIQTVIIELTDKDDNGPSFGKDTTFSTGVLATSRYHTNLLVVSAKDNDAQAPFASSYSLDDQRFFREGDDVKQTPNAFDIDSKNGIVFTNLPNYLDYQNGYFRMQVKATDKMDRSAAATLFIYVIRDGQRLKFTFQSPPEEVAKIRGEFIRAVNSTLGGDVRINDDSLHYHLQDNGDPIEDRTDLCYHMVRNNHVVPPEEAQQILDEYNVELGSTYSKYKAKPAGLCSLKVVTYTWSDHFWLWWILIALTLLIMLIALILICCLCCCCKRPVLEPYVDLDPNADYMPNREYEWQQQTVKME